MTKHNKKMKEIQLKDKFEDTMLIALAILNKAKRIGDARKIETICEEILHQWADDIVSEMGHKGRKLK